MNEKFYHDYISILEEELVPAMGCTEPIAIAYAGAIARKHMGALPDKVVLAVSGNIIKNVKSVIVPNSGRRKGLEVAVAVGIVAGKPDLELEAISEVTEKEIADTDKFLKEKEVLVKESDEKVPFDIQVTLYKGDESSYVRIFGKHTNIVKIKKNDEAIFEKEIEQNVETASEKRNAMTVESIVEFADTVNLDIVRPILERQIAYNMAIAEEGLLNSYGANIGSTLLKAYGNSTHNKVKAFAAAGSDARMSGCELPVIINSGSGNQGITASVPVIVYVREEGKSDEELLRALLVSNLITTHLKTGIGRLSAYCGATSAGAGAGAGICYLRGGRFKEIAHTVVNAIAINSGVICDGAKASCAAKIASSVEAGLLGMEMYANNSQFRDGDGIVIKGVENTIKAVGKLASEGMKATDEKIIEIMLGRC